MNLQERLTAAIQSRLTPENMAPEYVHKWKTITTPGGREIPAITASAPRKSRGTGWPSPATQNADGGENPQGNTGEHFTLQTAAGLTLQTAAALAGYSTPTSLTSAARLTGWGTPRVTTNNGIPCPEHTGKGSRLEDQASLQLVHHGPISTSPNIATESRGVLEPAFSRWLMGFPAAWDSCCPGWKAYELIQAVLAERLRPTFSDWQEAAGLPACVDTGIQLQLL